MRLRRSKFAFRLRTATKNASRQFKICVSPARSTRSDCFLCAGPHKTRLRRSKFPGSWPDCFPCAGPHKTRLRRSKFAFRLRRGTKSDAKDAKTWIGDMDLAEFPEIHMDAETWIRRHGSCRRSWDTKMLRHEYYDMNRTHGSCRGSWDSKMLRHESDDMAYGCLYTESGDMDLAEEPEIQRCWNMSPKTWILWRILRYEDAETPETWILQRILRYKWILQHEC